MNTSERISLLKQVDFGDIDGYGDPNLDQYFLDNNYWNRVINSKVYFIIGRKGTGKSAIYRMINEQGLQKGDLVENKDFGDFPFEKLLQLDDSNFVAPNQYQSIWKNLILNIFAKLIADNHLLCNATNRYFQEISEYVTKCVGNIVEMHKEVVNRTSKTGYGLNSNLFLKRETENNFTIGDGQNNISMINDKLENLIINYFVTCSDERKIIIQFDRLDDNYNQYQNTEQYYQAIISLFKVVYNLNQKFRAKNITNAKTVLYLRSDILKELGCRDAESARWDDYCLNISWAITNKQGWQNPKLLQMINKRIYASIKDEKIDFHAIFDKDTIDLKSVTGKLYDVFQYMVDKTMYRPRDLIQFCKCIQREVDEVGILNYRTIKNAEKKYGFWLVNKEIANEINPILNDTESVYELLKALGREQFSVSYFYEKFELFSIKMNAKDLLSYLYDIGILINIDSSSTPVKIRTSFRNEGKVDVNMDVEIHSGIWTGLNA